MTRKRKKSIEDNTTFLLVNHNEYIGKNQVIAYLLSKMKSYSGYFFISIGPSGSVYKNPEKKRIVRITIHQTIPCMQPNGLYKSAKDIVIDAISVNDDNFPGLVIDKHGNGMFGNPFAPIDETKLPTLGDESAGTLSDADPLIAEAVATLNMLSPSDPPKPDFGKEDEKIETM